MFGEPQISHYVPPLQKTSMVNVLDKDGPYTLFAPTNAAFNLMKEDQLRFLQSEEVGLYFTSYITLHYDTVICCTKVKLFISKS